jgi:hypothetical protein
MLNRQLVDAEATNLCKKGCRLWPVRAGAPLHLPKLLVINGSGAHNGHILCHNHYQPRRRCFDLGVELSCPLIGPMAPPLSPAPLEWVRHRF